MILPPDEFFMRRALQLAERARGFTAPNPVVGAVIVRNGKIIGEGWHHGAGKPHAEIEAIRSAGKKSLKGATIYVTLEPCCTTGRTPPCTEALIRAGFARVVAGCTDPNAKHAGRGFEILRAAGISVTTGVLEKECRRANTAFFHAITTGRPYVLLKMAATLDGKTATVSGDSKWVTATAARRRVQVLRRNSDAVMVGSHTFLADSPALTIRTPSGKVLRTPLRIVVSTRKLDLPEGWEQISLPDAAAWKEYLAGLGKRGIMQLLIEGGSELAASALHAEIVDEIEFHYAPKLLGGRNAVSLLGGDSPEKMNSAIAVSEMQIHRCGEDFLVSGKPVYTK